MASCCYLSPVSVLHKLNHDAQDWRILTRTSLGPPCVRYAANLSFCSHSVDGLFLKNARICLKRMYRGRFNYVPVRCEGKSSDASDKEDEVAISQATLIWRAIKLPIYSVALIPLTVAAAAAYLQTGIFSAGRYFGLLTSSILIIAWLNLSNDVYDFDTGADINKKESVVNMIGSRTGTLVAAYLLLCLGILGLTLVAAEAGDLRSLLLLASAIICGYIYQCPPLRLSYYGLGEPLCFAAFGPFATTAFYLMQIGSRSGHYLHSLTGSVFSASILVGCTTTLILFCSHFHQVDGDRAVGKFSPLVRIGTKTGSEVVKVAVTSLYFTLFILGVGRVLPFITVVFCALTFPVGNLVISYVKKNYNLPVSCAKQPAVESVAVTDRTSSSSRLSIHPVHSLWSCVMHGPYHITVDEAKIFMAKYYCVRLHTLFGLALAVGLVAARKFSSYSPRSIFS